jgi:hypothetical protein
MHDGKITYNLSDADFKRFGVDRAEFETWATGKGRAVTRRKTYANGVGY